MKKMIITLAVVVTGIVANAAAYSWEASYGRLFDGQGSDMVNRYAGTGYLFNVATVSQAAIITAFTSADGVSGSLGSALATGTFSSGRASASAPFSGPDATFDAYFVVLGKDASGNDAIYISDVVAADYQSVGEGSVIFDQQNSLSSAGFKDASAGYSSAGWYAASIPEPTSGLLVLLGMAALALRRRKA